MTSKLIVMNQIFVGKVWSKLAMNAFMVENFNVTMSKARNALALALRDSLPFSHAASLAAAFDRDIWWPFGNVTCKRDNYDEK